MKTTAPSSLLQALVKRATETREGPSTSLPAPTAKPSRTAVAATTGPTSFDALDRSRRDLTREYAEANTTVQRVPVVARPLRVGVIGLAGMGGSGKVARECAEGLAAAGHQVHFFTGPTGFFDAQTARDAQARETFTFHKIDSVPQSPTEPTPDWIRVLGCDLAAQILATGLDVLQVHYAAGLLDAAFYARELVRAQGKDLKLAVTLHGTDVTTWGTHPTHGPRLAELVRQCDSVSAVSQWMAREAQRTFGLERAPSVVTNAIDTQRFNPAQWTNIRQRIAPNGEVVLGHVSNFREIKRPLDTVEILARMRRAGIPTKLLLVGDGPMMAEVAARAEALGVGDHVIAVGKQEPERLAKYLAACDISLVTSESESFSLAALESMACGVPVVGTRCGGLEEVMAKIDTDVSGTSRLLAKVGDVDALADICTALIKSPKRYARVQKQCVLAPLEDFPKERQAQGYLEVIEECRPVGR